MTGQVYNSSEEERVRDIVEVCQYVLSDALLLEEFERQMRQHDLSEHSIESWNGYLIEEVGEFAKAMNERLEHQACIELVQVIAVAVQCIRHYAVKSGDIHDFMGDVVGMYNSEPEEREVPF